MASRRSFLAGLLAAVPTAARPSPARPKFGLQTYSLRYEAKKDLAATLELISELGFVDVEVSGFYDRTAKQYRRMLDDTGLEAVSLMASYDDLEKRPERVAEDARTLGARFVVASTLPHESYMTMEECRRGAEFLNDRGAILAKSDLRLCYHIHGSEFRPSPDGTVFDTMLRLTDEKLANFEMDIFWVAFARHDPVDFLRRYPGRFPVTHIKDIRPGIELGRLARDVREEDSVPLGTGIVDIPAALEAAARYGVEQHFIEDEAVNAEEQIRTSIGYLRDRNYW